MQNTYEATIRLPGGHNEKVMVQAATSSSAKALIESQYGVGCIVSGPIWK